MKRKMIEKVESSLRIAERGQNNTPSGLSREETLEMTTNLQWTLLNIEANKSVLFSPAESNMMEDELKDCLEITDRALSRCPQELDRRDLEEIENHLIQVRHILTWEREEM